MADCSVRASVTGRPAIDGAGVRMTRVLGPETIHDFDPFLMLDSFDSTNPADYLAGFPMHPHRGIETITYLASGRIDHRDSLGNEGSIRDGQAQWMCAGSGVLHEEMPKASGRMLGVQLWLNLPAAEKMASPAYNALDEVAEVWVSPAGEPVDPARRNAAGEPVDPTRRNAAGEPADGAEGEPVDGTAAASADNAEKARVLARVVAGEFAGVRGFVGDHLPATFLELRIPAGAYVRVPVAVGQAAYAFLLEGAATVAGRRHPAKTALAFASDGDAASFAAPDDAEARVLYFSAPRLDEPVAWGGPIVMNTDAELDQAFRELQAGMFVR